MAPTCLPCGLTHARSRQLAGSNSRRCSRMDRADAARNLSIAKTCLTGSRAAIDHLHMFPGPLFVSGQSARPLQSTEYNTIHATTRSRLSVSSRMNSLWVKFKRVFRSGTSAESQAGIANHSSCDIYSTKSGFPSQSATHRGKHLVAPADPPPNAPAPYAPAPTPSHTPAVPAS